MQSDSTTWLTFANWDNHAYFVKNSRYYIDRPVTTGEKAQKVDMEKDEKPRNAKEWEMWTGEVKEGIYYSNDVKAMRQAWLEEGIVPRANVRGFNSFNSIVRDCGKGECLVKQLPQLHADIEEFM